MTTIAKGSTVIKPADGGIALINTTEIALSNDGDASPTGVVLHGADGAGTNIGGAALSIRGGAGTGTGVGGNVVLQYTPAGSTGTTEGTPAAAVTLSGATGRVTMAALAQGGLVLPVLTTAVINAMAAPVEGQLVYDVTLGKLKIRVAAAWEVITSS